MERQNYFLDTNVFDYIFDNDINVAKLLDLGVYFTSNVQYSELRNVKDLQRRENLLKLYSSIPQQKLSLESGIWLDELYWDDDQPWVDDISDTVLALTNNSVNKPWKDSLIAEIAKNNTLILVTNDKDFQTKAKSINISVINAIELIGLFNNNSA